ncbi:MAG: UDP-N-acetylmuramate dehydrogenase [Dokdonella sp.]|uniref:UDP-N-acetylmuramate dehydrogenase n=1 Tax=Dokdonella sp. TaxID=2291710 RepID=UPI0025BA4ED2|nr:UDP-N-acetylmuramate dehydrogenase [Dokdonella sp.]MBZ0222093.1 UDP-N-acetylmuramate dehydrogenase [Dokdonella sp.]MCC7254394.1 UDP-N-acetylmuramate dehydrogenase [Dokdonella sp.]
MNRGSHSSSYSILENASLRARNSFGVEARAAMLIDVRKTDALRELFGYAMLQRGPVLVLGEGSNVLFTRDWPGVVLSLANRGIDVLADDEGGLRVRVAAGEHWNDFVHWALAKGACGLENLALIPGTVGAAPIQNIGAYGAEVAEFIRAVEVWDRRSAQFVQLDAAQCAFAYRDSLFKREIERYLIVAVEFLVPRVQPLRLDYAGIREELAAMGVADPTPASVAEAVTRLRRRKLPDPGQLGNAGSFFKNPLVDAAFAASLRARHPGLPVWNAAAGQTKLSAAWLIEQAGCKGQRDGDAGISDQHALVLVNHGQASGAQLWAFAQGVRERVHERFGVELEPEPRIV